MYNTKSLIVAALELWPLLISSQKYHLTLIFQSVSSHGNIYGILDINSSIEHTLFTQKAFNNLHFVSSGS